MISRHKGSMRGICVALSGALVLAFGASASARSEVVAKSDNLKLVASTPYDGGGELAAHGRYLYSSEANAVGGGQRGTAPKDGGLHIFDMEKMKEVGFLHCPGTDNDIEVVKPGIVAMAFSANICAPATGSGIMLIDVKNPLRPRIISTLQTGSSHTMKPHPDGKHLYMGGGNLTGTATRGTVIVDVSDPKKPKVATEASDVMDCHDVSFRKTKERVLGFCAGAIGTGEVQIWDATDPLAPTIISRIVNPAIQYSHYAVANRDATLLAIDDEAFAAHDCNTGQSPTGRVWLYDITNPMVPIVKGAFAPPRGGDGSTNIGTYVGWVGSWCLSHGLDWHPTKNMLAVTWFTGGFSVIDANDQAAPGEYAWFQASDSAAYSALWHDGYLATNDHKRGLDLFKIKGL